MTRGAARRLRLFLAAGLLLPLLALMAAWATTPASAATDSISAVVQVCTLPNGPSCDPTQPINGSDWTSSTTVYGSEVWWRVVVTNTGADALTDINVTSSLASSTTDCFGPVPVPGNSLAPGASYAYVCQTDPVTPVPSTVTQTVSAFGTGPSGTVTSPTSGPATANVQPNTPPPGASISAVLQICTASADSGCDPSRPLTDPSWALSSEALYPLSPSGQYARWRVFITNTGTLTLTTFDATDTLAQSDCGGSIPPNSGFNGTLAPGASTAYECQTNNVTTTTTNTVTVTAFPSPYPTGGAPVTSVPSSATSMGIPTGLATTSDTTNSVGLSWNAATGGATGYTVYRNGAQVGTTTTNSFTDTTVTPSTTYQYTVDAFNSLGVHSAQSAALSVTTAAVANPPTSTVLIPSTGATLSGSTHLDASASNATSVEFRLFGGIYGFNAPVVGTGTPTFYGWLCSWNTFTVPNGSYILVSEAFNLSGSAFSSGVTITVDNPLPTTSILVPSNGATVSATAATLDASASNATSVEFLLFGGIYGFNAPVVCTAKPTLYGWLCSWNTTTVPNGSYILVSEASGSTGTGFSPGVSITVKN